MLKNQDFIGQIDIGQIIGHVENAMVGEQQILKKEINLVQAFATENVAQEIIDAKIASEHLNELKKNSINLRFDFKCCGKRF